MKKAILALILGLSALGAGLPTTTVTLQMRLTVDPAQFGGLSTNDYLTNYNIVILQTNQVSTNFSGYSLLTNYPANFFLSQGPCGTWWTDRVSVASSPGFFVMFATNQNNGGAGPFSPLAVWLPNSPSGQASLTR